MRTWTTAIVLLAALLNIVSAQSSKIRVRMVTVATRADAEALLQEYKDGGAFIDLAVKYATVPGQPQSGYLGLVDPAQLSPEFREALRPLGPGEASPPFPSGSEFVILYRLERDFKEQADLHYKRGQELRKQGDIEGAIAEYERAILRYPEFIRAMFALANAFGEADRTIEEKALYEQITRLAPEFYQARYNLGRLLMAQNDVAGAVRSFEEVIRLKPDHAQAYVNLAALYLAMSNQASALQSARRAVEINPLLAGAHYNLGLALVKANLEEAKTAFEVAYALDATRLDAALNAAIALARLGRIEEARSRLEVLTRDHPDYEPAKQALSSLPVGEGPDSSLTAKEHSRRAEELKARGRWGEALGEWNQALALDPDHADSVEGMTRTLLERGRFDDARQLLAEQRSHRPGDPTLVLLEARLAYEEREFATAFERLSSLQTARLSDDQLLSAVELLLLLGRDDLALDLADTRTFEPQQRLRLAHYLATSGLYDPAALLLASVDRPEAELQKAQLLLRQLKFDEAEPVLTSFTARYPEAWRAYLLLGRLHIDAGRADEAIVALEKARQVRPRDANVLQQLALAYWQGGRPDDAITTLEASVALAPGAYQNRFELGRLLLERGELDQAKEELLAVLQVEPDHIRTYFLLGSLEQRRGQVEAARQYLAEFQRLKDKLAAAQQSMREKKEALRGKGFHP